VREKTKDHHLDLPLIPTKHIALHAVRYWWKEAWGGGWAKKRRAKKRKGRARYIL
jgi:hypothetical protein